LQILDDVLTNPKDNPDEPEEKVGKRSKWWWCVYAVLFVVLYFLSAGPYVYFTTLAGLRENVPMLDQIGDVFYSPIGLLIDWKVFDEYGWYYDYIMWWAKLTH